MSLLAIHGGTPTRREPFPNWPYYDEEEKQILNAVLSSGHWWRVNGQFTAQFEKQFADYHNAQAALAVTNGTHALELALLTENIGPGDEVIVPAFTFISTAMAVQRVGATPVPVDVDATSYCISIEATKNAISKNTKAIIPVHFAGHLADMVSLNKIASEHNLVIIQDAAHAHGAIRAGKKLGDWGSMACFSFQHLKLMTAGEGGAIIFPNKEKRELAFLYHSCGRAENTKEYTHEVLGSNYRLNEFSAAILQIQLSRLDKQNSLRHKNASIFNEKIKQIEMIKAQKISNDVNLNPTYMLVMDVDENINSNQMNFIIQALNMEGIPAYKNYPAIYRTKAFYKQPHLAISAEHWASKCPITERISIQGFWIHHRVLLGNEYDIDSVIQALDKVMKNIPVLT